EIPAARRRRRDGVLRYRPLARRHRTEQTAHLSHDFARWHLATHGHDSAVPAVEAPVVFEECGPIDAGHHRAPAEHWHRVSVRSVDTLHHGVVGALKGLVCSTPDRALD